MTPLEFEQQAKKSEKKSIQDIKYARISNSLIECFIAKKNRTALKIIFFLAMKQQGFLKSNTADSTTLKIGVKSFLDSTKTSKESFIGSLQSMQETSIRFYNQELNKITHLSVIPKFTYFKEKELAKDYIEISIYNEIIDLIKDVQNTFTIINVENLLQIKSPNTMKMVGLLKMIESFSTGVAKRKTYTLEELNLMFDVNYKIMYEFERNILKKVKKELDEESSISFVYDLKETKEQSRGRRKFDRCTITLISNEARQSVMKF